MIERPSSILVVDDEPDIVTTVGEFLTGLGHECVLTSDPEEALGRLREKPFDLVLTDLKMGTVGGMDILESAIGAELSGTRVILMTGFPTIENAIKALSTGAEDFLLKPFSFETLRHVVDRALNRQRMARENISLRESLALYRTSEALESPLDLEGYLAMVLEVAISEMDADTVQLGLFGTEGGRPALLDQVTRVRPGTSVHLDSGQLTNLLNRMSTETGPLLEAGEAGHGPLLAIPLRTAGELVGLLALRRHQGAAEFTKAQARALGIIGSGAAVAIKNARLYNHVQEQYLRAIQALVAAVEVKDPYTRGHSEMVARYAEAIAREADLPPQEVEGVRVAGLLHDAGKIGIPEKVLLKSGSLTQEEYEVIKEHVLFSERIIEPLRLEEYVVRPISEHHERLDGSGYPRGTRGEGISTQGRILAIADSFDAITSDRVYRTKMSADEALEILERLGSSKLDSELVKIMRRVVGNGPSGKPPAPRITG